MRGKLVIGNWKMNGSLDANRRLLQELLPPLAAVKGLEVAVCPPFPYLAQVGALLEGSSVALGAQNLHSAGQGAFTGEVGAGMLEELGCRYVLVGHSERRSLFGESDETVAEKFEAALRAGLVPVLCVGETLAQRRDGSTEAVIAGQVRAVLQRVGGAGIAAGVIAYEPVWAIGTGETASPEQAQAVHRHIRALLGEATATPILYGGSVKPDNAAALFAQPDIDGGLIGGASLEAASFLAICRAAQS
ncbi:triosephosphate isomerase [Azotobacter vinelandii CA]|uniref:Triosephosphate isomerase n=2 Tax=Azotobacter vinelandii TaxID=354 RepID=C1DL89_AZOVD|nr:triose-phosphate isomerase [Azotobacter vinelandii]ACO81082.1 triosephosphate isomerase [Azotobacter vinelandii DJ]AGK14036.1 triosephosphate isomerase [Azotobacter vinelandii CA]AGK18882.1 triosephosphate isomerase [Azotobacter vinelandii CA6]WKN21833.1 triose-phosphate isomerase [Azotobacter vinelandii]SFY28645.1 triosephosphate isomerase [Azotobacter vinelandii]